MRDIPVFTTENGAASLVLSQIPRRKFACIVVQSTLSPRAFLEECGDFCAMAGAESIYARGDLPEGMFPPYMTVIAMERPLSDLPHTDAALIPLGEGELARWLEFCNDRMALTPLASFLSEEDGRELLKNGACYFIHKDGERIGIGAVCGTAIRAVAALKRGAGRDVVLALCHALSGEKVSLEVADTNAPAMRLYSGLGFQKTGEIARWYKIR